MRTRLLPTMRLRALRQLPPQVALDRTDYSEKGDLAPLLEALAHLRRPQSSARSGARGSRLCKMGVLRRLDLCRPAQGAAGYSAYHGTDSPIQKVEPASHFTLRYLLWAMYLRRIRAAGATLSPAPTLFADSVGAFFNHIKVRSRNRPCFVPHHRTRDSTLSADTPLKAPVLLNEARA